MRAAVDSDGQLGHATQPPRTCGVDDFAPFPRAFEHAVAHANFRKVCGERLRHHVADERRDSGRRGGAEHADGFCRKIVRLQQPGSRRIVDVEDRVDAGRAAWSKVTSAKLPALKTVIVTGFGAVRDK